MPFDRHLPDADLAALHTIALDLRLTGSRGVLLGGLDRRYVDGLPIEPAPTMQLMSDLQHLNACEHLGEPSSRVIPLARWLATAHHLTSVHPQAARFKQAQEQIERQARERAGEAAAPPVQAPAPAPAAVVTPSAPVKQAAEARPLRWLHLSDIHLGLEDGYGHDIVLRALVDAFRDGGTLADRRPDVIFCTGDIAQSGKPAQYAAAGKLFEDLARATGTPMDRIFVVPGNHDLDREMVSESFVLPLDSREKVDSFFGSSAKGLVDRQFAFQRFAAFADFQRERWNLPLTAARPFLLTRCRVGSEVIDVIGLNTAWLAHQDEAQGKLILGERLLRQALDELDKAAEPATVRVALFHHPLDWLRDFEREAIQDLLAEGVDFALHGHLHAQRPTHVSAPTGSVAVLAAGAAYQGRKWPATALLVELAATEARVEAIMFREHGRGIWMRDATLNPRGDGVFRVPRRAVAARG